MTTDKAQRRMLANLSLLTVTLVWGATFTLTKNALVNIPVFPYLTLRFALASTLLILISALSRTTRMSFHKSTLKHGFWLGVLLFGAYALQTLGLTTASPTMAGFLSGLSVVLVPLLAVPILRNRMPARTWIGAFLALFGLALLCDMSLQPLTGGEIEVIGCTTFIALQVIYIEKYGANLDSLALAAVEITVLTLLCGITTLFTPGVWSHLGHWTTAWVYWAILICAIPGTSLAFWAQNAFQKYTSSSETAIIFSMEPVFAAIIAWWILGESLSGLQTLGAILIFLSMWVSDPTIRLSGKRFGWARLSRRSTR